MPYTPENQAEEPHGPVRRSPRVRRELRREPTGLPWIRRQSRARRSTPAAGRETPAPAAPGPARSAPRLPEWHEMTPGQRYTEWAQLRAWVTWLYDRYELAAEDKLPLCWPEHPGLVEELRALRAWRLEAYSGQPGTGQTACYWHTTLRTVLQAAKTQYAPGCRAGHRGTPHLVATDAETQKKWSRARPDEGIPIADLAAGQAMNSGGWISREQMAAAYDAGEAADLPGLDDHVMYEGGWWSPASTGWYANPVPPIPDQEQHEDPWREADDSSESGD